MQPKSNQTNIREENGMFQRDDQYRVFGTTPVENLFLIEYMPSADGDYVKVYLSGLFHSQQHDDGFGVKEMAAELSMTEARVEAALRYWERRRLVSRISEKPLVYRFYHLGQRLLTGQDTFTGDTEYIDFYEAVNALFGNRRKLKNQEITMAYEWVQDMGLPQEVVLMLLNHCADTRGINFSFKAAQSLAVTMREENILTTEDAEDYLSHTKQVHDGARAVLRRLNIRRLPTEDELALYKKWTGEWRFDQEAVLASLSETVKASNPSFAYVNGILEGLRRRGAGKTQSQVTKKLAEEGAMLQKTQEVLRILGARISAPAVLRAYQTLAESYPADLITLAAREVARRQGLFQDIEPLLQAWAEKGIQSAEAAAQQLSDDRNLDALLNDVFEACGQEGRPTGADRELLQKWLDAGHAQEFIVLAAGQARSAKAKLPYITRVLDNWQQQGITSAEQARAASRTGGKKGKSTAAQGYTQRQYTEEELLGGFVDIAGQAGKNDEG